MGLEASDTGKFAFNHLTVFAYLLRQIGDFSGATRLDRAALSYLDRMGGALNDEYADTVSALALDFVRLGSNAEAIELLDSYKTSLNATNRRLSSRERAALADLIRYRRSAGWHLMDAKTNSLVISEVASLPIHAGSSSRQVRSGGGIPERW
jgi:hypothetical protein